MNELNVNISKHSSRFFFTNLASLSFFIQSFCVSRLIACHSLKRSQYWSQRVNQMWVQVKSWVVNKKTTFVSCSMSIIQNSDLVEERGVDRQQIIGLHFTIFHQARQDGVTRHSDTIINQELLHTFMPFSFPLPSSNSTGSESTMISIIGWLTDSVNVYCPTRHNTGYFANALPSQSLG